MEMGKGMVMVLSMWLVLFWSCVQGGQGEGSGQESVLQHHCCSSQSGKDGEHGKCVQRNEMLSGPAGMQ